MAMTNAERQSAWRERMREKMATAKFALEAADDGDPLHQIVRLKQDLAKEKERSKELREKLKARDIHVDIYGNEKSKAETRALYAEAERERLQAEVDRLSEENARLRGEPLRDEPPVDDLVDRMDAAYDTGWRRAVLDFIDRRDTAGIPNEAHPWFSIRDDILSGAFAPDTPMGIPFYLELIEHCGAHAGEMLAQGVYRDALVEHIKRAA